MATGEKCPTTSYLRDFAVSLVNIRIRGERCPASNATPWNPIILVFVPTKQRWGTVFQTDHRVQMDRLNQRTKRYFPLGGEGEEELLRWILRCRVVPAGSNIPNNRIITRTIRKGGARCLRRCSLLHDRPQLLILTNGDYLLGGCLTDVIGLRYNDTSTPKCAGTLSLTLSSQRGREQPMKHCDFPEELAKLQSQTYVR